MTLPCLYCAATARTYTDPATPEDGYAVWCETCGYTSPFCATEAEAAKVHMDMHRFVRGNAAPAVTPKPKQAPLFADVPAMVPCAAQPAADSRTSAHSRDCGGGRDDQDHVDASSKEPSFP